MKDLYWLITVYFLGLVLAVIWLESLTSSF